MIRKRKPILSPRAIRGILADAAFQVPRAGGVIGRRARLPADADKVILALGRGERTGDALFGEPYEPR